jgi:hypothetical protein
MAKIFYKFVIYSVRATYISHVMDTDLLRTKIFSIPYVYRYDIYRNLFVILSYF